MASSEYGALVDTRLNALSINTYAEVQAFRVPGARQTGNMATVLGLMQTSRGKVWISRKRVRSDALRLFHEGAL